MFTYSHTVQYYETDQMRVAHHSNYIRWFEEARSAWLAAIGLPYGAMEELGIFIPVLGVNCIYKSPARFGDAVTVDVSCARYDGLRMNLEYAVTGPGGKICAAGESRHTFVNTDFRPIRLQRSQPEMHEILRQLAP